MGKYLSKMGWVVAIALVSMAAYTPFAVISKLANVRVSYISFGGATEATNNCTTNPCTIYRQSGEFATASRGSTGVYNLNITSGYYTVPPVCVGIASIVGTGIASIRQTAIPTTTQIQLDVRDAANSVTDAWVNAICIGAR